jgi:vacuolar-type H+-ATPase subunit I/STV1
MKFLVILKRILLTAAIVIGIFAVAIGLAIGVTFFIHALSPVGLIVTAVIFVLAVAIFVFIQVSKYNRW